MSKFCCERFEEYYNGGVVFEDGKMSSLHYPSICIIKPKSNNVVKSNYQYRFLIVCGFLEQPIKPVSIYISHCPFCGTHLYEFYKADEYVNEKEETFNA